MRKRFPLSKPSSKEGAGRSRIRQPCFRISRFRVAMRPEAGDFAFQGGGRFSLFVFRSVRRGLTAGFLRFGGLRPLAEGSDRFLWKIRPFEAIFFALWHESGPRFRCWCLVNLHIVYIWCVKYISRRFTTRLRDAEWQTAHFLAEPRLFLQRRPRARIRAKLLQSNVVRSASAMKRFGPEAHLP